MLFDRLLRRNELFRSHARIYHPFCLTT
jgi:hypothetical protein